MTKIFYALTRNLFRGSVSLSIFATIFTIFSSTVYAGEPLRVFWKDAAESSIRQTGKRDILPVNYRTIFINYQLAQELLSTLPLEKDVLAGRALAPVLELPSPSGRIERFSVTNSPIMEEGLASKYPEIMTFNGQGIDDPSATIRFDITPKGFHAMVLSPNGTWFIDPYFSEGTEYYISYYKADFYASLTRDKVVDCTVLSEEEIEEEIRYLAQTLGVTAGEQLRTYRIAAATTGEYTTFHGGTVTLGLAAVVTAMNRVNGVYEKEVSLRMILVANNDLIIYTNASTDPYTNNNGSTMLSQNQTTLDNLIGSANYDIGHVFSTGGGGIAGLGVVCRTGNKARGVTGLGSPIGDPFYIDYVAHEMGHQWGGNHSFNGSSGSCTGGNRNASTAYEPGSGSTIMAYAGICSPQNLQNNSDAYFHGVNLDEIIAYSTTGSGNGCAVVTQTGNLAPVVSVQAGGFSIPISTPFELTGSATDGNNDTLTYCWEQFDLGPTGAPGTPSGNAPIFRSFNPVTSPTRIFPRLTNLLNNTTLMGEILPTYARTLTFRLTARDNRSTGGGTGKATMSFSVTANAGPFTVTYPNAADSILGNTTRTITWNVANTNLSPVNTANVKVMLSTNGGLTFPIVLAESTPNDGSEEIVIPSFPTTQGRIKIAAVGNVYFDISNVNFTIVDNPIPVELSSFSAEAVGGTAQLRWSTATEVNNKGFNVFKLKVESSELITTRNGAESGEWENIGFVSGHGTTTETHNYSFVDGNLEAGVTQYRLQQVDLDGKYSFSNVVEVNSALPAGYVLEQNYPNPFNPGTVISYQLPVDGHVKIKVFDVLGNEVDLLVNEYKQAGSYKIDFNAAKLSGGVYYYEMNAGSNRITRKMTLLK